MGEEEGAQGRMEASAICICDQMCQLSKSFSEQGAHISNACLPTLGWGIWMGLIRTLRHSYLGQ